MYFLLSHWVVGWIIFSLIIILVLWVSCDTIPYLLHTITMNLMLHVGAGQLLLLLFCWTVEGMCDADVCMFIE